MSSETIQLRSYVRPAAVGAALVCLPLVGILLLSPLAPVRPQSVVPQAAPPTTLETPDTQQNGPSALPETPARWPSTLQLGMASGPERAASMKTMADFGLRYQYLAGGVNTGKGWATWTPRGEFVTAYVRESVDHGMIPVFTYYMLLHSVPGNTQAEKEALYTNLQDTATMTEYYNDLKLFFQRAGAFSNTVVVLHIEPDLWGFMHQRASRDNASTVPAQVAATGLSDLAGLPDNLSGFAQAIALLRDTYAPNVLLGYHLSVWGTGNDILYSKPPEMTIDALATRASNYFLSLQSNFDLAFAEFSDRDAAFKQYIYGDGGASWWSADDFQRNLRFLEKFVSTARKRVVMWQIPYGNTKMRAVNNTWNHYQDNRVEWLLDDPSRAGIDEYAQAGVIAFLFGRGADGATDASDAARDGVTNPEPINGNLGMSLSADDDGGFFRQKAKQYYDTGPIPLPSANSTPPSRVTIIAKTSPAGVPARLPSFVTSATVTPDSVVAGETVTITASVTSTAATTALVDVEVYTQAGQKAFQKWFDKESLAPDQSTEYSLSWQVPAAAAGGAYIVKVGIFAPDWGRLHAWNDSAAVVSVIAAGHPPRFTTSATLTPDSVPAGQTATIAASVTSSTAITALVDVEVYSRTGAKVFQAYFDNQTFGVGEQKVFDISWAVPSSAATGAYVLKMGIFAPGWGPLHVWNDMAAQLSVTADGQ